ncbi:DNA-directed RNA polymerase subunit alpha [Candidatus Karelsulcia muelleri]|uniref:DNA-directed RNA polymerase subunit alpha n=1 Tax=Candidatus Karelsulcia muelleri TaxID=336810 RepID=UPI000D7CB1C4|nr:DNA-directed RNA polymerase subunit alpha [Candidatus Karelsulcia muelleri]
MFFLKFTKKENLIVLKLTNYEGHFQIEPLYPGWGVTIGNTLRRVLLSSLEGYAISSVKIEGVDHEFATIKGVKEDMTEIILNLKKIRFKKKMEQEQEEEEDPGEKFNIIINNEKEEITAGDLGESIHLFEIINPDLIILNKNKFISLNITIVIKKGIGYVPSEENEKHINTEENEKHINTEENDGTISMDSIFTPIKNVKYTIENCSVSKNSTYERLFFEIKTDGTINPKDALIKASNLVIRHFKLLSNKKISLNYNKKYKKKKPTNENYFKLRNLLNSSLERKNLSVRTLNCLKKAKILTWGDLIKSNPTNLLNFKYLGKKSLEELDLIMKKLTIYYGMNLEDYNKNKNKNKKKNIYETRKKI